MPDRGTERHSPTMEFSRVTDGLPETRKTELVELADGDEFELEILPVTKRIGDATVRMLAYNGSVPACRGCRHSGSRAVGRASGRLPRGRRGW